MMKRLKQILYCLTFLLVLMLTMPVFAEDNVIIRLIDFDNSNLSLSIKADAVNLLPEFKVMDLISTGKKVIDIENAYWAGATQTFNLDNSIVKSIKVSQFSLQPAVLRIVLSSDVHEKLENIETNKTDASITFIIASIRPENKEIENIKNILEDNKLDLKEAEKTINILINSVNLLNDNIVLSNDKIINVKTPSILQNPSRIVFDTSELSFKISDSIKKFKLPNNEIVKITQNIDNTARISIETNEPAKYSYFLSKDSKILKIQKSSNNPINLPINAANMSIKRKIILDAGHGGNDAGAVRNGIFEKNINLAVVQKIQKILTDQGFQSVMTRDTDNALSLKERTDITNSELPDIFVSIHVNACENPNVKGIETHWYTPQSQVLAQKIQNSLISTTSNIDRGTVNSMFYVIHHTNIPSVLVEIGFISNDTERAELLTEDEQNLIAKAISDGVLQYLKSL